MRCAICDKKLPRKGWVYCPVSKNKFNPFHGISKKTHSHCARNEKLSHKMRVAAGLEKPTIRFINYDKNILIPIMI